MDWGSISQVLGVLAFILVLVDATRRRIDWLFRPAFVLSRLEVDPDGGLDAWLILRNRRPQTGYLTSVSLRAWMTDDPSRTQLNLGWRTALLITNTAEDSMAIIPQGGIIKRCRLRVV